MKFNLFCVVIRVQVDNSNVTKLDIKYVSLRLRMQNRRTKLNFLLNFRTLRKLSELYSRIF